MLITVLLHDSHSIQKYEQTFCSLSFYLNTTQTASGTEKLSSTISMAIYVRGTYRQTQLFYWLIMGLQQHVSALFLGHHQVVSRPIVGYIYYMLLIGNGCFGELSIILCVPWYVYFFILYLIIFLPGLIAPEFPVSMTLILYYLICMYKFFYLLVWSSTSERDSQRTPDL